MSMATNADQWKRRQIRISAASEFITYHAHTLCLGIGRLIVRPWEIQKFFYFSTLTLTKLTPILVYCLLKRNSYWFNVGKNTQYFPNIGININKILLVPRIYTSWTPLCRTRLSRTSRYLELFLAPLSWNQPRLSRTLLRYEETLVKIRQEVQSRHLLTRCTESWEMYWRAHGINESKVRTDWTYRWMQKATSCRCLGIKLLLQKFGQPRYLEPPLSRTIFRFPWEFEIAGFYCKDHFPDEKGLAFESWAQATTYLILIPFLSSFPTGILAHVNWRVEYGMWTMSPLEIVKTCQCIIPLTILANLTQWHFTTVRRRPAKMN